MPRQRHHRYIASSTTAIYSALIEAAGKRRWRASSELMRSLGSPLKGIEYSWRCNSLLRRGRVLEALPPVVLTLAETLRDSPCEVRLRLRCRVEPTVDGATLQVDAFYELNGPASFNARGWSEQIRGHCLRLLRAVELGVAPQCAGTSGQSSGSSSITVTNTADANGMPSLK